MGDICETRVPRKIFGFKGGGGSKRKLEGIA
jgi:hypothetical protein